MAIRSVTTNDIKAIRSLMQSEPGFWKQASSRKDPLEKELESANDLACVWEEDEGIVGFVCAHDLGFRAYLSELIVKESARSQGIGRQLVDHVENKLRSRGCPVLFPGGPPRGAGEPAGRRVLSPQRPPRHRKHRGLLPQPGHTGDDGGVPGRTHGREFRDSSLRNQRRTEGPDSQYLHQRQSGDPEPGDREGDSG